MKADPHAPLATVVEKALAQSSNAGFPVEDWPLNDKDGHSFDLNHLIEEFKFAAGVPLFLSLKAGING